MTPSDLRDHVALARQIGATLTVRFTGRLVVDEFTEPDHGLPGEVQFWHFLQFVGTDDLDGEGWEFYSAPDGRTISMPMFLMENGDEISLDDAKAMAEGRVVESRA